MKIERKYRPQLVCSRDNTRYVLTKLNVTKEHKGIAGPAVVATDGRMLAVVPCELDSTDVPGVVRADAVTVAARESTGYDVKMDHRGRSRKTKASHVNIALSESRMVCESSADLPRVDATQPTKLSDAGTFPNSSKIVPDFNGKKTVKISLSPSYLLSLCYAIGGDGKMVTIEQNVEDQYAPFVVRIPNSDNKAFGVLMPVSTTPR